ncbi:MAG: hypothetical protein Q4Q53_04810 [Methanocorpusculum sp.]|nr:hypothetical protein [Methanocorpusculum sp.]
MKKFLIVSLIAAVVAVMAIAGCIGGEPIVGDWTTAAGGQIAFKSDGTGTLTATVLLVSVNVPLTWKKTADKTYDIAAGDATTAFSAGTYKLSDDGKSLVGPITLTKVEKK